jgi:outer membrane protein assembly factor BamB
VVIPGSDLASKYQKKLIIQGDILVYSGDSADGGLSIVGVDMNSNKEIWKVSAPAGSQFAEDQESSAVSWVEPDGKFRRLDAMTGREKMSSKVDPMHAQNAQARVLVDTEKCYLLLNKPSAPGAMVASNFNLGSGFQQLPANGELYAFDKATGKTAWRVNAKNQMLVTENFSQMPIVVFSSRYTKPGNGNTRQGVGAFLSIDKRSGKRLIDDERPNLQPFQSFKLDTKKGRIELEAPGARIVHQVTGPGGK